MAFSPLIGFIVYLFKWSRASEDVEVNSLKANELADVAPSLGHQYDRTWTEERHSFLLSPLVMENSCSTLD